MKKKTLGTLLLATVVIGVALPTKSFAAQNNDVQSNGQVTFKADNSGTAPKNPIDPSDKTPGKPTDATNTSGTTKPGTNGPLSLDFASSLLFGEATITSDDAKYYAKPQSFTKDDGSLVDRPNYVQVSDKRGTFEGWTLKVTQDKQFAVKDDASKELDGAQLSFLNASLVSMTDTQYAPTAQSEFELTPGSTQVAPVEAAKDQGMGTWIYRFGDDQSMGKSVELSVPGKTPKMAKEYVTSLTWSLESTPKNTTTPVPPTKP